MIIIGILDYEILQEFVFPSACEVQYSRNIDRHHFHAVATPFENAGQMKSEC